jgi:ABC-type nitrate/sulfonate/bicarbonate transport system substrate-binding protein
MTTSIIVITLTIQAAAWCDYLEEHARRIYGIVTSPEQEAAATLAERIKKLPNPFAAKDVYRRHWSGLPDTATVEAACRLLEDEDWLFMERGKFTGGRPTAARYWVNPAVLGEK